MCTHGCVLAQEELSCPDLINPISIETEAEVTDSFPVMTVVEEAIDKGVMSGLEEDILPLDQNPEDILHKIPISSKTITTIEMRAGSQDLEIPPDFLL